MCIHMALSRFIFYIAHLLFFGLLIAGVAKGVSINDFEQSLNNWRVIPEGLTSTVSIFVVASEILLAAVWISGYKRVVCASLFFFMLLVYTTFLVAERISGGDASCGCFLLTEEPYMLQNFWFANTRNFIAMSFIAIFIASAGFGMRCPWATKANPDPGSH